MAANRSQPAYPGRPSGERLTLTVRRRMMLGMVVAKDLSHAEQRVWDAFPTGRLVEFGTGDAKGDDPAGGDGWGPDRQVRAEVLTALLCGAVDVEPGRAAGVYLQGARVTGKLDLPGATFMHRLRLDKCSVAGGIDLPEATTRTLDLRGCHLGAIRLYRATINGTFDLGGAHLDGKGGPALDAEGLTVTASMRCDKGFQADGEIHLMGASIGGQLSFAGAHLDGVGGPALDASGLTVAASVLCDERFQADGEIRLIGAGIGGSLTLAGAHLDGKGGLALAAGGLTVGRDMFCNEGFQADGEITLIGASVGGQLVLQGAHLDGLGRPALTAQGLTVAAVMFCDRGFQATGEVRLVAANIGALIDEKGSWPKHLRLNGLTYGDLTYMPARERIEWLKRSAGYAPQPYEQLAAYYRRLGLDEQARRVLLHKQRQRRRQRPWWARWWGWLQDALAGYGYAPGRALLLLAGAFAAGWVVFSTHHPVPAGPGPHPAFNSALYTVDVLIPAPAIAQAGDWYPQGIGLAVAAGLHALGWLLAITVIAAITRSFSRI
jgi:hypothetical protein